jgi:hypothetical protein
VASGEGNNQPTEEMGGCTKVKTGTTPRKGEIKGQWWFTMVSPNPCQGKITEGGHASALGLSRWQHREEAGLKVALWKHRKKKRQGERGEESGQDMTQRKDGGMTSRQNDEAEKQHIILPGDGSSRTVRSNQYNLRNWLTKKGQQTDRKKALVAQHREMEMWQDN